MAELIGLSRFRRMFRRTAGAEVGSSDLPRLDEFVHRKVSGMLRRGQAVAKGNGHTTIEATDVPISEGFLERMREYARYETSFRHDSVTELLGPIPKVHLPASTQTEAKLPSSWAGWSSPWAPPSPWSIRRCPDLGCRSGTRPTTSST